jgi:hypothetical protein
VAVVRLLGVVHLAHAGATQQARDGAGIEALTGDV